MAEELLPIQENEYKELLRQAVAVIENARASVAFHDKGNTFRVIRETLEELNYSIYYKVLDGQTYVPQHRERIMIVGFDRDRFRGEELFTFPEQHEADRTIGEILDPNAAPKYKLAA